MSQQSSKEDSATKIIDNYLENINLDSDLAQRKEKLIELLELIQNQIGHISKESATQICNKMNIPLSHIYGVITFYNSLKLEESSTYMINVCRGTACHVNGSEKLIDILENEIKKAKNPLLFNVDVVNCVGACSLAPVVVVNGQIHGHMDDQKIKDLIAKLDTESQTECPIKK